MNRKNKSAADVLDSVVKHNNADYISFFEIKHSLHERGFGLLMIIFALPLSIPAPVPPGVTMIPGAPLLFFSSQLLFGMDSPWLPKWIGNKTIKRTTLAFLITKASPYLRKVEKLMRQRLSFATSTTGERIIGLFCVIFSVSIMIPLPLTNFIPAIGIVLMSLGLISRDGIPIIFGIIVGSIGVSITTMIIFFGNKAVMSFIDKFIGI